MRNAWLVAQRELRSIFTQPIAYVVAIIITLLTGWVFASLLGAAALQPGIEPAMGNILAFFNVLALFFTPILTMRLLSEEQKSGTMELLMTLPIRDGEVVFGKFIAAMLFYLSILALTLYYPFILYSFGNPDVGPLLTSYLLSILWGSALVSIGVLASALSENQIVSAIVAFGITFLLFFIAFAGDFITANETLGNVFTELSLGTHQDALLEGLIRATDVLYYLLLTAVFLFAATRVMESRRWR